MRAADPLAGDRRRATNAAAQLPQSRGVVDRRRAGRRQWTASWALADAPRGRQGDPPAAAVRGAEAHLLYCLLAHCSTCAPAGSLTAAQVAGRRAAATKEHSASGRSALRVRGGTACLCRLFSRVSVYSERTRASGAASLAPGQPPDLISARPSAPTRMASDVLYSRYMSSFGQSFGGTFIGGTRRQSAFSLTHER